MKAFRTFLQCDIHLGKVVRESLSQSCIRGVHVSQEQAALVSLLHPVSVWEQPIRSWKVKSWYKCDDGLHSTAVRIVNQLPVIGGLRGAIS